MKHRVKMWARDAWARLVARTFVGRFTNRRVPRRLTILTGHCVTSDELNGFLPGDMKIRRETLKALLERVRRDCDLVTVSEGLRRLASGESGRSMVALTMDDGYKDNRTALLPLLRELDAPATIFLESRPLDEGRVNWSHTYFAILARATPEDLVRGYLEHSRDEATRAKLSEVLATGDRLVYRLKRVLKYEADAADRDRALDAVLADLGEDAAAPLRSLYMSWDDARALADAGIELGGHTVSHEVLSTLSADEQRREVADGRAAMRRELGADPVSFAYPFGRAWDWNDDSVEAVRVAGFSNASTTHAGTNLAGGDALRLKRWMLDEDVDVDRVICEARGGFEWLRGFGLNLSE